MPSLTDWLFSVFDAEPPISMAKIGKLNERKEFLAKKVIKSDYFPLFNSRIQQDINESPYICMQILHIIIYIYMDRLLTATHR